MMQIKLRSVGRYLVGKELFACGRYHQQMRGKFTHRHKRKIYRRHRLANTSPLGVYEELTVTDMEPTRCIASETTIYVEYAQFDLSISLDRFSGMLRAAGTTPGGMKWDNFQVEVLFSNTYDNMPFPTKNL